MRNTASANPLAELRELTGRDSARKRLRPGAVMGRMSLRRARALVPSPRAADAILVEQLVRSSQGDMHAFASLYDCTAARLFQLTLMVAGDQDRAESLTREAYLEIWRSAHCFDPARSSALSWLAGIAYQHAMASQQNIGPDRQQEELPQPDPDGPIRARSI